MPKPRLDLMILDYALYQVAAARDQAPPASGNAFDRLSGEGPGNWLARLLFDQPLRGRDGRPLPLSGASKTEGGKDFRAESPETTGILVRLASALAQARQLAWLRNRSLRELTEIADRDPSPYVYLQTGIWTYAKLLGRKRLPTHRLREAQLQIVSAWHRTQPAR